MDTFSPSMAFPVSIGTRAIDGFLPLAEVTAGKNHESFFGCSESPDSTGPAPLGLGLASPLFADCSSSAVHGDWSLCQSL